MEGHNSAGMNRKSVQAAPMLGHFPNPMSVTGNARFSVTLYQLLNRRRLLISRLFGNSKRSFNYVGCHRQPTRFANYVLKLARIFTIDRVVQYLTQKS